MVTNPIYGDSDGYYEELPDNTNSLHQCNSNAPASNVISASDTTSPTVPPPRKENPQEMTLELSESEREAIESKLNSNIPPSSSHDTTSLSSCFHKKEPTLQMFRWKNAFQNNWGEYACPTAPLVSCEAKNWNATNGKWHIDFINFPLNFLIWFKGHLIKLLAPLAHNA